MERTAAWWIKQLGLKAHPEGGFYKEVYRSAEHIPQEALPGRYTKAHAFGTSIYFLLPGDQISALHRLKSDEIWHFYLGDPVEITMIFDDGQLVQKVLGKDVENAQVFQVVIPSGCWFGARVLSKDGFALMGCSVSPGFEFEDFELAERGTLIKRFPQYKEIILGLTH